MSFPLTIKNHTYKLELALVDIDLIDPDPANPRTIADFEGEPATPDMVMNFFLKDPKEQKSTTELEKSIQETGSNVDPIILQRQGDRQKARDGNRRWVCFKHLNEKYPEDEQWSKIKSLILPEDMTEKDILHYLAQIHVVETKSWSERAKSEYATRMHEEGYSYEEIAKALGKRIATVKADIEKAQLSRECQEEIGSEQYAKISTLYDKSKALGNFKTVKEHRGDFYRAMRDGKVPNSKDSRKLAIIADDPDAVDILKSGTGPQALNDAFRFVAIKDPSAIGIFGKIMDFSKVLKEDEDTLVEYIGQGGDHSVVVEDFLDYLCSIFIRSGRRKIITKKMKKLLS